MADTQSIQQQLEGAFNLLGLASEYAIKHKKDQIAELINYATLLGCTDELFYKLMQYYNKRFIYNYKKDKCGKYLYEVLMELGDFNTMQRFHNFGRSFSTVMENGNTLFHLLAKMKMTKQLADTIDLMTGVEPEFGNQINERNHDNKTPFMLALDENNQEVMMYLMSKNIIVINDVEEGEPIIKKIERLSPNPEIEQDENQFGRFLVFKHKITNQYEVARQEAAEQAKKEEESIADDKRNYDQDKEDKKELVEQAKNDQESENDNVDDEPTDEESEDDNVNVDEPVAEKSEDESDTTDEPTDEESEDEPVAEESDDESDEEDEDPGFEESDDDDDIDIVDEDESDEAVDEDESESKVDEKSDTIFDKLITLNNQVQEIDESNISEKISLIKSFLSEAVKE